MQPTLQNLQVDRIDDAEFVLRARGLDARADHRKFVRRGVLQQDAHRRRRGTGSGRFVTRGGSLRAGSSRRGGRSRAQRASKGKRMIHLMSGRLEIGRCNRAKAETRGRNDGAEHGDELGEMMWGGDWPRRPAEHSDIEDNCCTDKKRLPSALLRSIQNHLRPAPRCLSTRCVCRAIPALFALCLF
jgi:hypothetical protein